MTGISGKKVLLERSRRTHREGAQILGRADPLEWCEVTLKLRRKAPLPEPRPQGEPTLTHAILEAEHGASDADIETVLRVLTAQGMKILAKRRATRTVRAAGPASVMESVFGVHLLRVAHEGHRYRGRVGDIYLPQELGEIVIGVFGLDNRPMVRRRRGLEDRAANRTIPPPNARPWFFPQELANAYNFPPADCTGQTVGLIELGGEVVDADLRTFAETAKIPKVPSVVIVDAESLSATDGGDADSTGEVMLDVEVVAGVCSGASIVCYFSHFTEQGWIDALDTAIHDTKHNPTVLSVSWGLAEGEDIWTGQAMSAVNDTLKEAANLGIPVCIAAGDDGSSDQVSDGRAYVDFPSSSPYVLCVGGTALRRQPDGNVETVWKDGDGTRADGGGSTGGGVSTVFPVPEWQAGVAVPSVNPSPIAGRCVPDVAANAAGSTGYYMVASGKGQVSGGTSAAAPLWAGLIACLNANLGANKHVNYLTPLLYVPNKNTGGQPLGALACNDITQGDNNTAAAGGYSAAPGYDAVTGWGSPDGMKLLQLLQ
jgi:kumamolisin